jgi:hypothetical protein
MTEPLEFYDGDDDNAHTKFQQWRHQHYQDGYFLNYKGLSNTMLHRVPCWHLRDPWDRNEELGSLTRRRKVCSTNRRDLEQWAKKRGVRTLGQCQDCSLS